MIFGRAGRTARTLKSPPEENPGVSPLTVSQWERGHAQGDFSRDLEHFPPCSIIVSIGKAALL